MLGKFYKYIILGLINVIFGYVFYANSLAGKLAMLKKLKLEQFLLDAIKPYEMQLIRLKRKKPPLCKHGQLKSIEDRTKCD